MEQVPHPSVRPGPTAVAGTSGSLLPGVDNEPMGDLLLPLVVLLLLVPQALAAAAGEEDVPGFHVFTGKLHYQPGERISYGATIDAAAYPDQASSKVLRVELVNAAGKVVATDTQQYGLASTRGAGHKELFGTLEPEASAALPPGRFELRATSLDQRSGLTLRDTHAFVVQEEGDNAVAETPFRFVKDFSIIPGPDGRWHLFSITGEFVDNHDWEPDGQERAFSHLSSPDLHTWTVHPPVLSITDDTYPDGEEHYQDRNVWAPHVIEHEGLYYLFYTSVNEAMSQSISLATSPDLFEWTPHEQNPVFTLESADWAHWFRDSWSDCRDPMVLEAEGRFYLYVTAHAKEAVDGQKGIVAVSTSDDLVSWSTGRIAVRGDNAMESPHVWKTGDRYHMTVSAGGHGTYISDDPASGWRRQAFPRPDVAAVETHIETSRGYAEEAVPLGDGTHLVAVLTWRHWGNTIYFFRTQMEAGRIAGYEPVTHPLAPPERK